MYKRKEIIGDCTLYLGDSMKILPTLEQVDCVVTDPPYKLTSGGKNKDKTKTMGGKYLSKNYNNKGDIIKCDIKWADFMPLSFNVLRDGHAYIMSNDKQLRNLLNSANDAGFSFHNLLTWNKRNKIPNRWYMKQTEFIGFFYKGEAKYINDCGDGNLLKIANVTDSKWVIRNDKQSERNGRPHPTEKPVELMAHLIGNSTKQGKTVIDPFMGVGSTGVACVKLNRKFIGVEIDEDYFNIACERIEQASRQKDLFR